MPGVKAVLTAEDLKPLNLHWMPTLAGDVQAVLADEKVLFQSQEVAFVVAERILKKDAKQQALIRELREELGIDTEQSCLAPLAFASHGYDDFHLLMPLYVCRVWNGTVVPKEGQELRWVRPARLRDFPMPPADAPLIPVLRDLL